MPARDDVSAYLPFLPVVNVLTTTYGYGGTRVGGYGRMYEAKNDDILTRALR